MNTLPFRANVTRLTDDELILLDILFSGGTWEDVLCRDTFKEQWNLGYSHGLNDAELHVCLESLCKHGVLRVESDERGPCFSITNHGGQLWSQERCPVWERFCTSRYTDTAWGRTLMTIIATTSAIRDTCLDLWPMYPARRRKVEVRDYGLISWHPFRKLYVGMATYFEPREWTGAEYIAYKTACLEHEEIVRRERSWWCRVPELQKFIPSKGLTSGST
jgi:hypothetical protein